LIELKIRRDAKDGEFPLLELFQGFDMSPAIPRIFPEGAEGLEDIVVRIGRSPKYMRVMQNDGSISIGREYLRKGDSLHLYLDLVHEVTHVRQQREGHQLYDPNFRYIDRPTELEAMRITIAEAKRCGMDEKELIEYLEVPWISREEHLELVERLGLSGSRE
jgi:hypothetical protein